MHGHGKLIESNGDTYEGEFVNNIKDGKGVYTKYIKTAKSSILLERKYEETWVSGKLQQSLLYEEYWGEEELHNILQLFDPSLISIFKDKGIDNGAKFLSLSKLDLIEMGLFEIISDLLYKRIIMAHKRRGNEDILLKREQAALTFHRTKQWLISVFSNLPFLQQHSETLLIFGRK